MSDSEASSATLVVDPKALGLNQRVRRLLSLAVPIIGGMLSQNLLNLIDTAMVGRLENPEPALAAVGMGGMVNWLASAFFLGLGSGVQAFVARRTGAKDPAGAVGAVHSAMLISLIVVVPYGIGLAFAAPALFTLLSPDQAVIALGGPYLAVRMCAMPFMIANFSFRGYWNGIGRSTIYLRTIVIIHLTNVVLNYLLIYGKFGFPKLGVTGAGLASALAFVVGTITYVVLALRFSRRHGFLQRDPARKGTTKQVVRLSVPAGIQGVFFAAGFVAFFRIAADLGTKELAVSNMLIQLSMVCILPSLGFGLAAATFVGQSLGANNPQGAKTWGWNAAFLAAAIMIVPGAVLALFPDTWLALLIKDSPVSVALGTMPLVLLAIYQPFDAIGMVITQALIGAGAARSVMIVSVILQWGLFLPITYWVSTGPHGSLLMLWICFGVWRALYSAAVGWLFQQGGWAKSRV